MTTIYPFNMEMMENTQQPISYITSQYITDTPRAIGLTKFLTEADSLNTYMQAVKFIAKEYPIGFPLGASPDRMALMTAAMIEYGHKVGVSWMEAVQLCYFTADGRMAIMGDLALSLIRKSHPGFRMSTETEGTIEDGTLSVTITANRGSETRSFTYTLDQAKRAGLYRPDDPKSSEFWRNDPERQCYYRALDRMARDMFGDVIHHAYVYEGLDETAFMDKRSVKSNKVNAKETDNIVKRATKEKAEVSEQEVPEQEVPGQESENVDDHVATEEAEAEPEASAEVVHENEYTSAALEDAPEHLVVAVQTLQDQYEEIAEMGTSSEMIGVIRDIFPNLGHLIDSIPGRRSKRRVLAVVDKFIREPYAVKSWFELEYDLDEVTFDPNIDLLGARAAEEPAEPEIDYTPIDKVLGILSDIDKETRMRASESVAEFYAHVDADLHPNFYTALEHFVDSTFEGDNHNYSGVDDFIFRGPIDEIEKAMRTTWKEFESTSKKMRIM